MNQGEYDRIFAYLHTGKASSDLTKNERDSLRRKCKKFVVKDGLVYFRDKKTNRDLQVCNYFQFSRALFMARYSTCIGCHNQPKVTGP